MMGHHTHGRFQESNLFRELFEAIVARCVEVGLVTGKHLSVDGTQVPANAGIKSRVTREAFTEAAQVNRTVREYLEELVAQNPIPEASTAGSEATLAENVLARLPEKLSTTDPDACEDYRAGATIDLVHAKETRGRRLKCPLLVLWGERSTIARLYDVK